MADDQTPHPPDPGGWGAPGAPIEEEPTPAPAAAAAPTRPAMSIADLQGPVRNVFFGMLAVGIIGLIGILTGTWKPDWTGILLMLLGLAGAAVLWMGVAKGLGVRPPFASRYVELLAGLTATVIGIGGIVEAVFDLDQAGSSSFILDAIVYIALAAVGLFLLLATGRAWPGGVGAVAAPVKPGAERGGRLAFLGILLVLLGWLVNITIGVWRWEPAALVTFLILIIAVVILMISEDAFGPRIPIPAAWVAAAVAIWAGLIALVQHLQGFIGEDDLSPGLDDWLGMLLYVGGIIVVIIGTVMMALAAGPARGTGGPSVEPPSPAA